MRNYINRPPRGKLFYNIAALLDKEPKKYNQVELSRIFNVSRERIRQLTLKPDLREKLRLPGLNKHYCPDCGKIIHKVSKYCRLCHNERNKAKSITFICPECGKQFERSAFQVLSRIRMNLSPKIGPFCSRHCLGKHVGRCYGFVAHPENSSCGCFRRKWNYEDIYAQWEAGKLGIEIAKSLGIPLSTIYSILNKNPNYKPNKKYPESHECIGCGEITVRNSPFCSSSCRSSIRELVKYYENREHKSLLIK